MSSCCGSNCNCKDNSNISLKKKIEIDFLYLDLSVCERCQCADTNLDEAINEVSSVLKSAGYEISVNKVNIISKELAEKYEFISSPTIRINGNDITMEVNETPCKECGDLCGDEVECRVWIYEGVEYQEPPKAMIINAILKHVYSGNKEVKIEKKKYELPKNLELFFNGLNGKKS